MRIRLLILLAACMAAIPGQPVRAGECTAGDCFRGKTISIVVGFGAGGGYDAYARMIASELQRLTQATAVVRNRPGAGGLLALNELAAVLGDGLTLGMINVSAAVTAQRLKLEAVRFDIRKFSWLAGIGAEERVLVTAVGGPAILSGAGAAARPLRWAAGGQTDDMAVSAALLSEALGMKARIVTGYKGTNEAVLGVIRGEADAVIISADSARRYSDSRAITITAVLSTSRSPLLPDVPTLFEFAGSAVVDQDWIRLLIELSGLGRGIAAAPGTPDSRVAFLRGALRDILNDDGFRRRAEQAGRIVHYQSPQELTDAVAATLAGGQGKLMHVVLEKYY